MSGYKYPGKNSRVSIYGLKKVKVKAEGASSTAYQREYRHEPNKPLRAYCRMILAEESERSSATFPRERVLVVINYLEEVRQGDVVEWGRKRLRIIAPPDYFEGRNLELKLTCELLEADPELGEAKP